MRAGVDLVVLLLATGGDNRCVELEFIYSRHSAPTEGNPRAFETLQTANGMDTPDGSAQFSRLIQQAIIGVCSFPVTVDSYRANHSSPKVLIKCPFSVISTV